jgi:ribosomal protein L7/L12
LGLREPESWSAEVDALLRDGKKIQAIKVYREATGAGLKEAKEAVEKLGQTRRRACFLTSASRCAPACTKALVASADT